MFHYYQFKVCLIGPEPTIYRTFALPCEATFFDLHIAIQLACGWQNYHGYMFQNEDEENLAKPYSVEFDASNIEEEEEEDNIPDDVAIKLSSYFKDGSKIKRCLYIYDLRDYWLHAVTLQRIVEEEDLFLRKLLDGDRAFPPEDCGGIQGYKELIALRQTGKIPDSVDWNDAENIVELLQDWSPDEFIFDKTKAFFDLPAQFQKKSA